jgi:hypothetical protein
MILCAKLWSSKIDLNTELTEKVGKFLEIVCLAKYSFFTFGGCTHYYNI